VWIAAQFTRGGKKMTALWQYARYALSTLAAVAFALTPNYPSRSSAVAAWRWEMTQRHAAALQDALRREDRWSGTPGAEVAPVAHAGRSRLLGDDLLVVRRQWW